MLSLPNAGARRYVADVISLKCSQCNAELLPEAKFCRRCGAVVAADSVAAAFNSSELPTAMLDQRTAATTHDLNPRVTSPETPLRTVADAVVLAAGDVSGSKRRGRMILIGSVGAVLLLLGIFAAVINERAISHSRTTDDAALIYPGSQTVVDVSSGDGRAIQLRTNDSLEQVLAWYEKSIKPTKTMRLTSTSVVLKNENVTTTLASEAGKTNILIKRVR